MKRSLIILAANCTLLFGGCGLLDPSGTTWVEGQVVESSTGQPVPYAKLSVNGNGNSASGGQILPGIYDSDANGKFSFRFEGKELTTFRLTAFAEPGYFTDPGAAVGIRGGRRNKNIKVPVLTPSWVRIQLRDDPPRTLTRVYVWGFDAQGENTIFPRDTSYVRSMTGMNSGIINAEILYESNGQRIRRQWPITPILLDTVDVLITF